MVARNRAAGAQHVGRDQRLVVAGVVEQARGHVDGVAEVVAADLHRLAERDAHLQLQAGLREAGQRVAPPHHDVDLLVHLVRRLDRLHGRGNTAIRPSPSVLTTTPPVAGTRREIASTVSVTIWDASVLPSNSYSACCRGDRRRRRRDAGWLTCGWLARVRSGDLQRLSR
jgi:hypothetical protein